MNELLFSVAIDNTLLDNEYLTISIHRTESLLFLDWKRQISLSERKTGFLHALNLTYQYNINNWLISDLNIFFISPEEKDWLLTEWIELASKSPILKIAVVCSENYDLLINGNDFTSLGQKQYQNKGKIEHLVFMDFPIARTWIQTDLNI